MPRPTQTLKGNANAPNQNVATSARGKRDIRRHSQHITGSVPRDGDGDGGGSAGGGDGMQFNNQP
jgi:hypothetical protein